MCGSPCSSVCGDVRQRSDVARPDVDEQLLAGQRQDLGGNGVAQPLVRDVQRGVLHSLEGDERLDPAERRVARQPVAPIRAVQSGEPAHPVGHLVDGHRPGGVARVGAARDDVLHDHQEVGALLVDERRIDRRMIKRQRDSR